MIQTKDDLSFPVYINDNNICIGKSVSVGNE